MLVRLPSGCKHSGLMLPPPPRGLSPASGRCRERPGRWVSPSHSARTTAKPNQGGAVAFPPCARPASINLQWLHPAHHPALQGSQLTPCLFSFPSLTTGANAGLESEARNAHRPHTGAAVGQKRENAPNPGGHSSDFLRPRASPASGYVGCL